MDIYPKSAQAVEALKEFDKKQTVISAIDPHHRCTDKCQYYVCDKWKVAVCKTSRHTHLCNECCTLLEKTNEGSFCKITAYQKYGPEEHAYANATKMLYGRKHSNVHWCQSTNKGKRTKPNVQHAKRVRQMLNLIYLSNERKKITQESKAKMKARLKQILKPLTVEAYYKAPFAKARARRTSTILRRPEYLYSLRMQKAAHTMQAHRRKLGAWSFAIAR